MDLWKNLERITTRLQNKSVKIIILDFDGTLTPIVQSPNLASLPRETRNLLIKLSRKKGLYLAIISGRKLEDIKNKVNLKNIIYAGNHGLEGEILNERYIFSIPDKKLAILSDIKKQLGQMAKQFKNILIEDKKIVLSLHYRLLPKKYIPVVKSNFYSLIMPYTQSGQLSILAGKMVFDIYPKVRWNKGNFAKLVIDKIHKQTNTLPSTIFIGDDLTDEAVFRKLKTGITIKVGEDKQSLAKYRLKNTDDVLKFLKWIDTKF